MNATTALRPGAAGRTALLLCWAALAAVGHAAENTDPHRITLKLADGSTITGRLAIDALTVQTLFGPLTVPVEHVRGFVPGLNSRPQLAQRLDGLFEALGADAVEQRDAAQQELLRLGEALRPLLRDHLADEDPERKLRVEKIIEALDEAREEVEDEAVAMPILRDDKVETGVFTIVGRIAPRSFEITTRYGTLSIALADIDRAGRQMAGAKQGVRRTVILDQSDIAARGFHNSGIRLARGQQVSIRARGQLSMTPWGNNAVSSPDGAVNYGWYVPNEIPNGALVARVGRGQPFVVGSSHQFRAERSGVLELAIGINKAQAKRAFPGEYEVNIRVSAPR